MMQNYPLYNHPPISNLKQLISFQSENNPQKTAFQYLDKNKTIKTITYQQFQQEIEALKAFFITRD